MKTVFDTCEPRPEVLKGELKEDIFAARLKKVIDGDAEEVYQDPDRFFQNTFVTEGLRQLLTEALGRLTGRQPANNPFVRLETAFGGGKTHNLIALYHAAQGNAGADVLKDIVPPEFVPNPGDIDVVGVVGTDLSPADGLLHEDGIRTYTLWGELAYQLGGTAGYARARQSDEQKAAPGTSLFDELIGERPTLIMIDEIARHMRVGQGIPTATGKSDLAEQTVAFLMALLEFASGRGNVVVVLTLAGADDAFSQETEALRQQLKEAGRVSARQEMVLTPTGETEMAAIVRHRLFADVDSNAAQEAAAVYGQAYKQWFTQNIEIPQSATRAEYAQEFEQTYPFHPELLNTLNRKTSTIPNFQKTRGALRLLAWVIRRLWQAKPANTLTIHPHHIELAHSEIANDLTSRLQRPAFKQVIEADIVSAKSGSRAHAQEIDEPWIESGKPPYARNVATTVFLHSLVQGTATGVSPAELRLGTLGPGDDPLLVDRAIERLDDTCWFFEWDGNRYRFKTEPSLNKIIQDEMGMILKTRAKEELDKRIQQVWRKGMFTPVYFPADASGVDDDARAPKLVVMHYDAVRMQAGEEEPPDLVCKIADYAGTMGSFRRFKNNVVFLVADEDQVENMVQVVRRYLAIARIVSDGDRMREFTPEDRKKLKKEGEAAELDVRVAITKTYRHLFFPRTDAPQAYSNLAHELLPAQDQGEVNKDQSDVALRTLKAHKKVLTGDEPMLSAFYLKSRAWDKNQESISTEDLRRAFSRKISLPILLDPNQLKKTIKNGLDTQVWIYYNAHEQKGYDHESPPPAIQLSDEALLYTPAEAGRLNVIIKGKEPVSPGGNGEPTPEQTCPVCGNPISACTCGDEGGDGLPVHLKGEGPPSQAFQQVLDGCHDHGVTGLVKLRVLLQGDGKDGADNLRRLGLALPQLGKGDYRLSMNYQAEFGQDEYASLNLALDAQRYKQLKQITDNLAQDAGAFHFNLTLEGSYPDGLDTGGIDFQTLHEVLTTVGLGRIEVQAEPMPVEESP